MSRRCRHEEAEKAVQGLRKGLDAQLQRYETKTGRSIPSRNRTAVDLICRHMQHCLTRLWQQQTSLTAGLSCLQQTLWPCVLQSIRPTTAAGLLQHVFSVLLRLHDGLILCISGECRHAGDQQMATASEYPSQLATAANKKRADGYTRLYSDAIVYSGCGWDEFMDASAGLQERLWQAVRPFLSKQQQRNKEAWWERLTETRARSMEVLLETIETTSLQLQQQFRDISQQFPVQLAKVLSKDGNAAAVQLSLADKMEKFHVTWGKDVIQLERYASDFQVGDPQGALPLHRTTFEQWKAIIMPSATFLPSVKRPRRVIAESSDDEEPNETTPAADTKSKYHHQPSSTTDTTTTTGLQVRLHHKTLSSTKQSSSRSKQQQSVSDIKQDFGVRVQDLETARETLEAEEAVATLAAAAVDQDTNHDNCHHCDDAQALQVQRLERLLKRALRSQKDETEIWNARDCLREACMNAGNQLLWSTADDDDKTRLDLLGRAIDYFERSRSLVEAQQKLHHKMVLGRAKHSSTTEDAFFRRNLILLHGQASANAGIAKLELGLCYKDGDILRKMHLRQGIKEMENAQARAEAMEASAAQDDDCGDTVGTLLDILQALQLMSLSGRWHGTALWQQGRRKESLERFKTAGSYSEKAKVLLSNLTQTEELVEAEIELRTECYCAWTTLADLSMQALEQASVMDLRERAGVLGEIFGNAMEALRSASMASKLISALVIKTETEWGDYCAEKGLISDRDLTGAASDLQVWWNSRKESTQQIQPGGNRVSVPSRNDLPAGRLRLGDSAPTGRFVLSETVRRRRRPKLKVGFGGYGNIGPVIHHEERNAPDVKKYRKWGDQLLPQIVDESSGRLIPKLPYVSMVPEMPEELRALQRQWEDCEA